MNKIYFTKIRSTRLGLGLEIKEVADYLDINRETYRQKEINPDKFTVREAKKILVLFNRKFEDLF